MTNEPLQLLSDSCLDFRMKFGSVLSMMFITSLVLSFISLVVHMLFLLSLLDRSTMKHLLDEFGACSHSHRHVLALLALRWSLVELGYQTPQNEGRQNLAQGPLTSFAYRI